METITTGAKYNNGITSRNQSSPREDGPVWTGSSQSVGDQSSHLGVVGAGTPQTSRPCAGNVSANPLASISERDCREVSASVKSQREVWIAEQEETKEYDRWLDEVAIQTQALLAQEEEEHYALMQRVNAFAAGYNDEGGF